MGTKRRIIDRGNSGRLTPQIIDAWHRCDYSALHLLLRLNPWELSPLPLEITVLGVDADDDPVDPRSTRAADLTRPKIVALQRELLAAAGWPGGARAAYEENLARAIAWADHCREQVAHPNPGEQGTGCDPASRREKLEEAEAEVEYHKQLLADLPRVQRKWARRIKAPADSSHAKNPI